MYIVCIYYTGIRVHVYIYVHTYIYIYIYKLFSACQGDSFIVFIYYLFVVERSCKVFCGRLPHVAFIFFFTCSRLGMFN